MKKTILTLTVMLAAAALIAVFPGPASAAVSGPCVNCHTMHSSQGSTSLPTDWEANFDTNLRGSLLASDCIGCHTTTGTNPYDATADSPTPFVYVGSGSKYLAGGYFTDGGDSHDDKSHTIGWVGDPAGYDGSSGTFTEYTGDTTGGLACAGTAGCHGIQTVSDEAKAVAGGHHENSLKPALGYRMLMVGSDEVVGTEASDYEKDLNDGDTPVTGDPHNLYSANQTTGASISELCGKCHSNFHGTGEDHTKNADDAWIRHPSDELIPTGWEIQTLTNYTPVDWLNNPVGTIDAAAPATGNMYATCISCHRAHGTEYNDILRWDYSAQNAGSPSVTTGCLGCHDKQRGS